MNRFEIGRCRRILTRSSCNPPRDKNNLLITFDDFVGSAALVI